MDLSRGSEAKLTWFDFNLCCVSPLRYPAPFLASVFKLFMVSVVTNSHAHQYYCRLYDEYGDFVRTGACLTHL